MLDLYHRPQEGQLDPGGAGPESSQCIRIALIPSSVEKITDLEPLILYVFPSLPTPLT